MTISQAISQLRVLGQPQRRAIRFLAPGPQLRLALCVLAVALGFGLLFAANTYAAYAQLFGATLSLAPDGMVDDVAAQTREYLVISAALLVALVLVIGAVCVASLHRVLGPIVAIERHVRALAAGRYTSRVVLRGGDRHCAELARCLNELAQTLERGTPRS